MSQLIHTYQCANCGSNSVQAVKALYSSGTWQTKTQGYSYGVAHVPGHSHHGHYHAGHSVPVSSTNVSYQSGSTELARLLAPPAQPQRRSLAVPFMFGIFLTRIIHESVV